MSRVDVSAWAYRWALWSPATAKYVHSPCTWNTTAGIDFDPHPPSWIEQLNRSRVAITEVCRLRSQCYRDHSAGLMAYVNSCIVRRYDCASELPQVRPRRHAGSAGCSRAAQRGDEEPQGNAIQIASSSASPVLTRVTCSTGITNSLPSPGRPV